MEVRLAGLPVSADVVVRGPPWRMTLTSATVGWPATIGPGDTFVSSVIPTFGMSHVGVAAMLDQNGIISVQPYLDDAGTIVAGSPVTLNLTAATPGFLDMNTGQMMGSIIISITNGSGTDANLTNPLAVLQA